MVRILYSEGKLGEGVPVFCVFAGKSTDTKPTDGVMTGSSFREVNTGKSYVYEEEEQVWYDEDGGSNE